MDRPEAQLAIISSEAFKQWLTGGQVDDGAFDALADQFITEERHKKLLTMIHDAALRNSPRRLARIKFAYMCLNEEPEAQDEFIQDVFGEYARGINPREGPSLELADKNVGKILETLETRLGMPKP